MSGIKAFTLLVTHGQTLNVPNSNTTFNEGYLLGVAALTT